jgi:Uma2 family endonuclease
MARILTEAEIMLKLPDFRWTLERYHAATEAGILTKYDKVELLFGKIVPKAKIGITHAKVVRKVTQRLMNSLPEESYTVGVHNPITLIEDSEPEPDLYIAKGPIESYDHHPYPNDLLLVIEVSDSTITHDRGPKRFTYAVAGIEEYWIINVFEKQIERFTSPVPEKGDYERKEIFKPGDTFTSLHLGDFNVSDLLLKD